MNSLIPSRIARLRERMRNEHVAACLIPTSDPHSSEYLPEHWQARLYYSGFTGSAGTLVVTADFAGLWTDSRYFEQAAEQLAGTGVTLMRLNTPRTPEHMEWLCDHLFEGDTLAVAADCIAVGSARHLRSELETVGARLRTDLDPVALEWDDRPPLPHQPVVAHALDYAITTRAEKLRRVRDGMARTGATHHLVSTLDDIAWITNLRGRDVDYNPVFLSHLLLDADTCTLFVEPTKIAPELREELIHDGIRLAPYEAIADALANLSDDDLLLYDPMRVVVAVMAKLPERVARVELPNPSTMMKAVKGDRELDHVRQTMREDGAALVQGFHRVEQALQAGQHVTELDVVSILHTARAARAGFVSESFSTIAAYMAHGALPHYVPDAAHAAVVRADGLLLVDSGGQYLGGTTDITRVWAFGATTDEQRRDYTAVLQGMIDLSRTQFPQGASGQQIDALARAPLWQIGTDYGHGTGHGVGYFLNVHEGPHGIRPPRSGSIAISLEPGMISSIEPGLYKPGRHGVRHENLAVVHEGPQTEFGRFLRFETLTLCPFDNRAIEAQLLSAPQREWLNAYHHRVERELASLLDESDRSWLHARCAPIS